MDKQMMEYESEEYDEYMSTEDEESAQIANKVNEQLDPTYMLSMVKVGITEMMNT